MSERRRAIASPRHDPAEVIRGFLRLLARLAPKMRDMPRG